MHLTLQRSSLLFFLFFFFFFFSPKNREVGNPSRCTLGDTKLGQMYCNTLQLIAVRPAQTQCPPPLLNCMSIINNSPLTVN